ncbi:hypothetical protein BJX64DRAFT_293013 [Aspergillus heterothallicus]
MIFDHVLDPSGEVILVVRNPVAQFQPTPPEPSESDTDTDARPPSKRARVSRKTGKASVDIQEQGQNHKDPKCIEIRIQVSGKHLSLGSPVFHETLNGDRKNGKFFREDGCMELRVDDWDIDAFLVVLYILHAQTHKVRHAVTLERLARIAVIANHYQCEGVATFSHVWYTGVEFPPVIGADPELILTSIWVAFYFRWQEEFELFTRWCMELSHEEISSPKFPIPAQIIGR